MPPRVSTPSTPSPADRLDAGLVVAVGGVGGLDYCGVGLRLAGVGRLPYAYRVFRWGHGFGRWHADLTRVADRDRKARELAGLVRGYLADHAAAPVFLVAKSGGCGLVVEALERLEANAVERVILLAPAISPSYDLGPALAAVRREIVVFWSPLDLVILGAGTRLFGTIDRVRTASAGLVGFRIPGKSARNGPYARLRQVRWRPRMAAAGNLGGHLGPDSPIFLGKYVLPLLRPAAPDPAPGIATRDQADPAEGRYP